MYMNGLVHESGEDGSLKQERVKYKKRNEVKNGNGKDVFSSNGKTDFKPGIEYIDKTFLFDVIMLPFLWGIYLMSHILCMNWRQSINFFIRYMYYYPC